MWARPARNARRPATTASANARAISGGFWARAIAVLTRTAERPLRRGRARGVREEGVATEVDPLELGPAAFEVQAANGDRDHVGLRGVQAAREDVVRSELAGAMDQA